MSLNTFNSPGSRNVLDTKVTAAAGGKALGSGLNKGQNNGGSNSVAHPQGTKTSTGSKTYGQKNISGGGGGKSAVPGFSGNGMINGKA